MVGQSWQAFWAMGGDGIYVWPAYGVAALVMVGLVIASLYRLRRVQNAVRVLEASDEGRRARRSRRAERALQAARTEAGDSPPVLPRAAGTQVAGSGSIRNDA